MNFVDTKLEGVFIAEPEKIEDKRGFFCRTFCKNEFEKLGLNPDVVQCNVSFNAQQGTLRGMHFQISPFEEAKLIRCTMGKIYDVVVDLRPGSKTYKQWIAVDLSAENRKMLYVPEGFAHGFQTLTDNTEVYYQMSEFYAPQYSRGVRWNDPVFGIRWPERVRSISEKDQTYADYKD
jgi:dTDP-4-dehydrorhamnose 3,5-epimerase